MLAAADDLKPTLSNHRSGLHPELLQRWIETRRRRQTPTREGRARSILLATAATTASSASWKDKTSSIRRHQGRRTTAGRLLYKGSKLGDPPP